MTRTASAMIPTRLGLPTLLKALAIVALIAGALMVDGPRAAWAQEEPRCDVTDLGTLGGDAGGELQAEGRWTTGDCDSRFLTDSDAHTYRFELAEDGAVRIDLTSPDGDSFLHLLAEDGSRIAHDDDGGDGLDARIEFVLTPGVYLVEAAMGAGRDRGPADFALTIHRATNCDPIDLGTLEPDAELTADGVWAVEDCSARYRENRPAHVYRFELPQDGLVRIDLVAPEGGDPYVFLLSSDGGYLYSDDDGGVRYNARIENDLAAGTYLVDATTHGARDHVHELTEFTLTIRLVEPDTFRLKAEAVHAPDEVIAGEPFLVHYRVGNLGQRALPSTYAAATYLVAPERVFEVSRLVSTRGGRWQAGASYHSGPQTASATSTALGGLTPFAITLNAPGPAWVSLGIVILDGLGRESGFHRTWRTLQVLSGPTFDPVTVSADGDDYAVAAAADSEGMVTVDVRAVTDPAADVGRAARAKAIYAAGVRVRVLDDLFARPAIAALQQQHAAVPAPEDAAPVVVPNPSSHALLTAFADHYASAIATSGVAARVTAGELISQAAVEDLTLSAADAASAQWLSLAASWSTLQERIAGGAALSFADALTVQSQVAYAERIIAPIVAAGEIVRTARAAELGWDDAGVRRMVAGLAAGAACDGGATALREALEAARFVGAGQLITLDAELRAALPVHGIVDDAVVCGVTEADAATTQFLRGLTIIGSSELRALIAPRPPAPLASHRLRIITRLIEDGRVEHGVELADGERIFPRIRFLPTTAAVGVWKISSAVEVDGTAIGWIRAQRLADGRVETDFRGADGGVITPAIRHLPADAPVGVWLRGSEIEAPPVAPPAE